MKHVFRVSTPTAQSYGTGNDVVNSWTWRCAYHPAGLTERREEKSDDELDSLPYPCDQTVWKYIHSPSGVLFPQFHTWGGHEIVSELNATDAWPLLMCERMDLGLVNKNRISRYSALWVRYGNYLGPLISPHYAWKCISSLTIAIRDLFFIIDWRNQWPSSPTIVYTHMETRQTPGTNVRLPGRINVTLSSIRGPPSVYF